MKLKKLIKIVLSILIAIIVIILVLAALIFSAPQRFPYTVAEAEADSLLASEIVDMISDAVVDEAGNMVREGGQIVVGGNDMYVSLCRKHYMAGDLGPEGLQFFDDGYP